ncbi:MAG: ComEC/Rec2 family competence protein [Bacteroidota bacterium]
MIRWIPFVFVRIVVFFVAGILFAIHVLDVPAVALTLAGLTSLYLIIYCLRTRGLQYSFNLGWIALPAVMLAGYLHLSWRTHARYDDHFMHAGKVEFYQAVLTSASQEKGQSWRVEARVRRVKAGHWKNTTGKAILYFSKKDFSKPFQYGDVLMIKGCPQPVQPPGNPGEFDYGKFLSFKNVYHRHALRHANVKHIGYDSPNPLMSYAIRARQWAGDVLKRNVNGEREQAITFALVLGVTDGLDDELLSAYAATGTLHVLAVSGCHVSIIYMIILWLLKPLGRSAWGLWVTAFVSLFCLWAYAYITGLSPSVLRAVTMFSFVAIARPWSRTTNIYNTLAASAFCLLLYDPFLIMSVGFQLSYLAVAGIVYLQPKLYQLWEPAYRWLDELWKITAVSLAAQLATFSLGLLYFHQFPNYFLISNLLVIPISSCVLILGLVVLAVSFITFLGNLFGFLLAGLITVLNGIVFAVEKFPFSLSEDIYISSEQALLLMGMIIAIVLLFERRRFYYVFFIICLVSGYSMLSWIHFRTEVAKQKMIVYKVPGHSAMDFIDKGKAYFLADTSLWRQEKKINYHIRPHRIMTGVSNVTKMPFVRKVTGGELISWKGKTILMITGRDFQCPGQLSVDFLLVTRNALTNLSQIKSGLHYSKLILDSSNSFYIADKLKAQAAQRHIEVHSVLHQGAFEVNLENIHT